MLRRLRVKIACFPTDGKGTPLYCSWPGRRRRRRGRRRRK